MNAQQLKNAILQEAIEGRLVPQDPNDEPASVLLERIRAEKERLIKEGKIKRSKKTATDEEIEAPFEIPEGWEWCRLDDLASYKKGPFGSSLTKSMFVPDTPDVYKVYEQKNAINKDATLGHYYIDRDKYEELKGFAVLPYDIIVSCAGTIGETYILPQEIREGIINQALMLIRLFDRSITYFYLLYFDYILKNEAAKESKGTAIKNIPPFEVLKNFLIPIPPLAEQKRIANEVERWFAVVEALESNEGDLLKAIDQAKSKILDLAIHGKLVPQDPNDEPAIDLLKRINPNFKPCNKENIPFIIPQSWEWTTISEISSSILYGVSESAKESGNYKLLRITDIQNNNVNWETVPFTDYDDKKSISYLLHDGDILFARTGATVGKSYLVEGVPQPSIYASYLIRVQTTNMILPTYIKKYFESKYYWEQITISSVGIGQPNVNGTILAGLAIPIPPYKEQQRIVTKIEELFAVLDGIKYNLNVNDR